MKVKPKRILPQFAKDKILLFLANCGEKVNGFKTLLYIILAFEAIQILLLILGLLR